MESVTQNRTAPAQKDQFNSFFFTGLKFLIGFLLILGITGIILILLSGSEGAIFKAIGLGIAIIWACIFLSYFVWAVYFYNINYGKTDYDWERIYHDKEMKKLGLTSGEGDMEEPMQNPHKDETFGLPSGTVRGMIAFTLLFGAIAMLVISMGMSNEIDQNSFFWDHFEFFKTAFLMMIAFYFGSRSLEFLQKRWQTPPTPTGNGNQNQPQQQGMTVGNNGQDVNIPSVQQAKAPVQNVAAPAVTPNGMKQLLNTQVEDKSVHDEEDHNKHLEFEFKQISDVKYQKFLNDEQIKEVAKEHNLEFATIKAVVKVESAGKGFLSDGHPKILFEGHKFWANLKELNINPEDKLRGNEDILYPKWTKKFYLGGTKEYDRLNRAMAINRDAAIYSASWGLFQIMGENIKDSVGYVKRYKTAQEFYDAQHESEHEHLLDFMDFISNKKLKDTDGKAKPLIEYLRAKNWAMFAYGYNGSGYKQNAYDIKLQKSYEQIKASENIYAN